MPTLTRADYIPQGGTIGIIGGGQLGQMMALDAKYAGMKVIILTVALSAAAALLFPVPEEKEGGDGA